MDLASPEIMPKILEQVTPDILIGESNEVLDMKSEVRDMVWSTLFDVLELDEETRAMFYATENDKEHVASKLYSTQKSVPYYMLDLPEERDIFEIQAYARKKMAERFASLPPEQARMALTEFIRQNYARHLEAQDGSPPCARLYDIENSLNPKLAAMLKVRDPHMAKEIIKIMDENPDRSILGFFGVGHVADPFCHQAQEIFDGPFENLRYHLRDRDIKFSKLIDWV